MRYDVPCQHFTEGQGVCGATPTRLYGSGRCCQQHTPAAIRGLPENPKPDPALTLQGLRAAAQVADLPPPMTASQLTDDRAVASGKRRASPEVIADARRRLAITAKPVETTRPEQPATDVPLF